MATETKCADGSLGKLGHLLLELVEHGRHRRIGVRADPPFVLDLLMALSAFGRRRIQVSGKYLGVRIKPSRQAIARRRFGAMRGSR